MNAFSTKLEVRWSDLDPNFHIRHSVYYDYAAFARIHFLNEHGLTTSFMIEHHFGPILFREECVFRKEIKFGDIVSIDLQLLKARSDFSRWSIQHDLKKLDIVAAVLTVDGAWIDTVHRKLAIPPQQVADTFSQMVKAETFEWIK